MCSVPRSTGPGRANLLAGNRRCDGGRYHVEQVREEREALRVLEEDVAERPAEKRVLEPVGECVHRCRRRAPEQAERGQDGAQQRRPLAYGPQGGGGQERVQLDVDEPAQIPAERADQPGVGGRDFEQMAFQPVGVVVEGHGAAGLVDDPIEHLEVGDGLAVERPQFAPHLVGVVAGGRADQPLDAVVEDVALARPGRAAATGQHVLFEDAGAHPVHLRVAPGGHSRDSRHRSR